MTSIAHKTKETFPLFYRQLSFYDPDSVNPQITIIGAGGIGSPVVKELVQLGVRHLTVYDGDTVALHNLGTTEYRPHDVGAFKVDALGALVKEYAVGPVSYTGIPAPFQGTEPLAADIVISGVDTLRARRVIFSAVSKAKIPFFIDGRIGGEQIRVYSIQPGVPADRRLYLATLTQEPAPLPCTGQQVRFVGSIIAGLIVRAVAKWTTHRTYEPEVLMKTDPLVLLVSRGHK